MAIQFGQKILEFYEDVESLSCLLESSTDRCDEEHNFSLSTRIISSIYFPVSQKESLTFQLSGPDYLLITPILGLRNHYLLLGVGCLFIQSTKDVASHSVLFSDSHLHAFSV